MHGPDELDDAIEVARSHDPRVVVEAMLEGREIECGVLEGLDGGPPEASVPGEVVVGGDHEFYDFAAKYLPDEGTDLVDPGRPARRRGRRGAGAGLRRRSRRWPARVWPGSTSSSPATARVVVNEVNTMPGFTPVSMFPLLWAATGLDYPALVDRLVQTALARPTGLR